MTALNLGIQESGNPEIWNPKIPKIKILKIKIRVAQNVGKVWISRKKSSWPHLGPSGPIFCVGRKKKWENFVYFPWWANGPYSPFKETRAHCNKWALLEARSQTSTKETSENAKSSQERGFWFGHVSFVRVHGLPPSSEQFFDSFKLVGLAGIQKCSWATWLRSVLMRAHIEPHGPISDRNFGMFWQNMFGGSRIFGLGLFIHTRSSHVATLMICLT